MNTSRQRPTIEVSSSVGGWPSPWPAVAELAATLPPNSWTLVGGLMTQLHTVHRGLGIIRPTNDVDIVLHVETSRGAPSTTAHALEGLGYQLQAPIDPRNNTAHRFIRGDTAVDLVTGQARLEHVDVLIADHPAPRVIERLRGRDMVQIEGGTQALRRTVNARLEMEPGVFTTVSVPRPFGAVILKAAAFTTDSRDRDRHLFDAAALLACIEDPFTERRHFAGSDRRRLAALQDALSPQHGAWSAMPPSARDEAEAALAILCSRAS